MRFNNGKVFSPNAVFIGYVFVSAAAIVFLMNPLIGPILLLPGLFVALTTYGTEIRFDDKVVKEFTSYFGFIESAKEHSYAGHRYITVVPTRQSYTMHSRTNMSATVSDYFFTVTLFNSTFRNKIEICKKEERDEAQRIAWELADKMDLEYFEYDPKKIRNIFLGR